MGITSADIAKLAGVSRSAVSFVLNGHFNKVSLEKRQKILTIARDLNYHPNRAARILVKKSAEHIGIVTPPFPSAIYSSMISHLSYLLNENGYSSSIVMPENKSNEMECLHGLESVGVCGIIGTNFLNDISFVIGNLSVPVVSMSPFPNQYEVRIDLKNAMIQTVEHFKWHGHSRIALLIPRKSVTPLQVDGYLEALGSSPAYLLEVTGNENFNSELLRMIQSEKVTAFAVTNDLLAARFISHLAGKGIRVPDDIAVIGFDGTAFDETFLQPLSSNIYPAREIAEQAVKLLFEKITSENFAFRSPAILVPPKLYCGRTCGCGTEHQTSSMIWDGQPLLLEDRT